MSRTSPYISIDVAEISTNENALAELSLSELPPAFASPSKFFRDTSNSSPARSPLLRSPLMFSSLDSPFPAAYGNSASPFLSFAGTLSPLLSMSNSGVDSPPISRGSPFSYFRPKMASPMAYNLPSPQPQDANFSMVFSGKFRSPQQLKENRSFVQRLDFEEENSRTESEAFAPTSSSHFPAPSSVNSSALLKLDSECLPGPKGPVKDPELEKLRENMRVPVPNPRPIEVHRVNATAQRLDPTKITSANKPVARIGAVGTQGPGYTVTRAHATTTKVEKGKDTDKRLRQKDKERMAKEGKEQAAVEKSSPKKCSPKTVVPPSTVKKGGTGRVTFVQTPSPEGTKALRFVFNPSSNTPLKPTNLNASSSAFRKTPSQKSPPRDAAGSVKNTQHSPVKSSREKPASAQKSSPSTRHSADDSKQNPEFFATPTASSRIRPRQGVIGISPPNASVRKQNPCNCKKSQCLKLYCECFAAGIYCNGCNCLNCANTKKTEVMRQQAIQATLERNPNAFQPKIQKQGSDEKSGGVDAHAMHNTGCHCKKSACLKKYCECFQAGIYCGANCKCIECKNFLGSSSLTETKTPSKATRSRAPEADATGSESPVSSAPSTPRMSSPDVRKNILLSESSGQSAQNKVAVGRKRPSSTCSEANIRKKTKYNDREDSHLSSNKTQGTPQLSVFGDWRPSMSKPVAISIFSYLDNDDLYNASIVNRLWTKLALDEEIWQYD